MIKSSFLVPTYSTDSLYAIYDKTPASCLCLEFSILSTCLDSLESASSDAANSISCEYISYLLSIMRDVMVDRYLNSQDCATLVAPVPMAGPTGYSE